MKERVIMGKFTVANGKPRCDANGNCPPVEHIQEENHKPNGHVPLDMPARSVALMDLANQCTLTGAVLSTVALGFIWSDKLFLAVTLSMVADVLDIIDGPIARATPGRHPALGQVGAKLDCYSDVVSHFVVPASLLMKIGAMNPICITAAALLVACGVFRHAYNDVHGSVEKGRCYIGVTSDYMPSLMALVMHLVPILGMDTTSWVLCGVTLSMGYGLVTHHLRTRRYTGSDLLCVVLYTTSLAISCLIVAVWEAQRPVPWASFEGVSFIVHLLLAYPCYFRFIEFHW